MTEEEAQKFEALTARIDQLAATMELVAETPSIAAALKRLAEIETNIVGAEQRLADTRQQEAALAQRENALDQRERQIKIREFTFDQKVEEATGQLRASYLSLTAADDAMKSRVLNYAGMLDGFDPGIRALPDWPAISKMLGVVDEIEEMRDVPMKHVREGTTGDAFPAGTTLTRGVPCSDHDDLPRPQPQNRKPVRSAVVRRRERRAAERRATQ